MPPIKNTISDLGRGGIFSEKPSSENFIKTLILVYFSLVKKHSKEYPPPDPKKNTPSAAGGVIFLLEVFQIPPPLPEIGCGGVPLRNFFSLLTFAWGDKKMYRKKGDFFPYQLVNLILSWMKNVWKNVLSCSSAYLIFRKMRKSLVSWVGSGGLGGVGGSEFCSVL